METEQSRAERFRAEHPGAFLLDAARPGDLTAYLRTRGWLDADEEIAALTRAGEGNMNLVLRVETGARSFIVKQSRPWVEKYDTIDAPWDRARVEAAFYRAVSREPALAASVPTLLGDDAEGRVLLLEDLGATRDFLACYGGAVIEAATLADVMGWLAALHALEIPEAERASFANRDMRALNHEHIFSLPLRRENGLELDEILPGLAAVAATLVEHDRYRARVEELGRLYLGATKGALLHGDFYPGSWLDTDDGIRIIDPEFCFVGPGEFDRGVMLAHLVLAGQPAASIDAVLAACAASESHDEGLALGFAGAEIMRRLIGVAQLPLDADLVQRKDWLDRSVALVVDADRGALR